MDMRWLWSGSKVVVPRGLASWLKEMEMEQIQQMLQAAVWMALDSELIEAASQMGVRYLLPICRLLDM